MADEDLRPILAQLRAGLEAIYGDRLVQLVLYGSRARGDARPDSDIDVLVVLRGAVDSREEISRCSEFIAAISLKYDTVICPVHISDDRFRSENSPLLLNIRREGVPA